MRKKSTDLKLVTLEEYENVFERDNEFIKTGYRLNFNSSKKILRSLFMFHNESFNVWSHLAGLILFGILLGYTIMWLEIPAKVSQMHLVEDLRHGILTSINDLASNAYKYENIIEEQMMEIYKEAYILGQEFEVKIVDMYNRIKSGNSTERFRPLLNKLENIIGKMDSKEYDWIDVSRKASIPSMKVSRWPIFVYIFSAMICLLCSSIFHLFTAHSMNMSKIMSRLDYAGISILIAGSFYPHIYYAFFCFPGK